MPRVLVTGSSGLLGRHVAAALCEAGYDVLGLDAAPPPQGARWFHVAADAADLGAVAELAAGCEAMVPIAAIPRPTGRAATDVFRINMAAVFAAAEAARICRIERVVYASSFSVLGYPFFERPVPPPYLPVDECHPSAAQDVYALSKWLGEETLEAYVRRGSFAAVSLRMPWIQTPETFHAAVGSRRIRADAAHDLWAYLDARDAASAFVAALERPLTGHSRLFLSASDTYCETPTAKLIANAYPHVPLRTVFAGHQAVIDCSAAREALGFVPRFSWRDYPPAATP